MSASARSPFATCTLATRYRTLRVALPTSVARIGFRQAVLMARLVVVRFQRIRRLPFATCTSPTLSKDTARSRCQSGVAGISGKQIGSGFAALAGRRQGASAVSPIVEKRVHSLVHERRGLAALELRCKPDRT